MARFLGYLSDDEDFLDLVDEVINERRPRIFRERPNNFDKYNDHEFKQRYRLAKNVVRFIIDEITEEISSHTDRNYALSAEQMVFISLHFLATGSLIKLIADNNGVDESTASRAINKVINVIARLRPQFVKIPATEEERSDVRQDFFNVARFPRCLGAVDCTHVKIISPGGPEAEIYRNRWPGSAHDSNIFRNSRIRHRFENGEFGDALMVGDSGYGIKPYLITPLRNPQSPAENLFSEAQIRTRNAIERCFGVLKRRFPVLALGIRLKTEKVEGIVVACAVLHNIAIIMKDDVPEGINEEIEREIVLGEIDHPQIHENIRAPNNNNIVRDVLITQYYQNLL